MTVKYPKAGDLWCYKCLDGSVEHLLVLKVSTTADHGFATVLYLELGYIDDFIDTFAMMWDTAWELIA